jgi:hypothetical protein
MNVVSTGYGNLQRTLWMAVLALVFLTGCTKDRVTLTQIQPATGGQRYAAMDLAEGTHAVPIDDKTREALKSSYFNFLGKIAKNMEQGRKESGETGLRNMKATYRVTEYEPGTALFRHFMTFTGLGDSTMKIRVVFSDEAKTVGEIEVGSRVTYDDLLSPIDSQHAENLWDQVWGYFAKNYLKQATG